jgi:hypothetical protein
LALTIRSNFVILKTTKEKMTTTKFLVKVNRGAFQVTRYVQRLDRAPIVMTTNPKLALLMGRLTAEDAVNAIQNSRCTAELVAVTTRARTSVARL